MTTTAEKNLRFRKSAVAKRAPAIRVEHGDEPQAHPGCRMTESEFLEWVQDRTRAEWVNEEVHIMSPVNNNHEAIQGWLYRLLSEFVETHDLGRVLGSEFFIRLPNPPARHLPDLFFISKDRLKLIRHTYFEGAPDLIIEIVSPESHSRDYGLKFENYEKAGVCEYWIIDPATRSFDIFSLQKKSFSPIPLKSRRLHSAILKGLALDPACLWQPKLPTIASIMSNLR